jgi:prepilin peptidase CpaA
MAVMQILATGALLALIALAVAADLRHRRIPNGLVLAGMTLGLLFQAWAPTGAGLFVAGGGSLGLGTALFGGLVGLALLLPMYALRALGAGDVKLLAMAGVWFGPASIAWAALWTLLAGGLLSLAVAACSGVLPRVLANLREMLLHTLVQAQLRRLPQVGTPSTPTTGRLPYAVAIGCGVGIELLRLQSQGAA